MKKRIGIAALTVFTVGALFTGNIFLRQSIDARRSVADFDTLAQTVEMRPAVVNTTPAPQPDAHDEEPANAETTPTAIETYGALWEQNPDFVGWISIEDTPINYPVMQSRDRPDFYLKHNFDGQYSDYGVPYAEEACAVDMSNNIVIYGHHMQSGVMFSALVKYADESFWQAHPIVRFDTLSGYGEYEIMYAFAFDTNHEDFRYNEYTDMNRTAFAAFIAECKERCAYDTGLTAEYGDSLITLSTCDYTYPNGRFVVVARKLDTP